MHVAEVAAQIAAKSVRDAETLQMMRAQAEGAPLATVLSGTSISKDTYYRRRSKFIAALKRRLVEIASMTTSSIGFMLLIHALTVMTLTMVGDAPHVPGVTDPLPTLRAHADPVTLRSKALHLCRVQEYDRCLELLDRARMIDPAGEQGASVVSARHDAEHALRKVPATQP